MRKTKFVRFLEIVPGAVVWLAFIAPVILSFLAPAILAMYVIIFDLFWLYKSSVMGFHLIYGFRKMRHDMKVDWRQKCESLEKNPINYDWQDVYHAVIFATYKEELGTLIPSIQSVLDSDFPSSRIIVVIATEKRTGEHAKMIGETLTEKYGNKFMKFIVTTHPDILGEVKAKGANVKYAAQKLQHYIDEVNIPYDKLVVTTCDADTRFHRRYLPALTYNYITNPNRDHRSFQPIPLYNNNIWYAPAISRLIAFGNSFWQMIEATRPWRMINFSTHAMSLKTLVEIDFWDVTVVNEDSRQYWRAYFKFDGDHEVVPICVPIYMDAVLANSYWLTIKNQYLQKKRWYYGVEHFPYVVTNCIKSTKIPIGDRFIKIYRLFEANYSLATSSIYIAVIAWLPIIFGNKFNETVLAQNLPIMVRVLLGLTWFGLIVSTTISLLLLPPKPPGFGRRHHVWMLLQWVLIPVQAICFSSLPAIDAQTRFMLGKYMTFWVTEKKALK